mgnify:CR=1 FL=1
MRFGGSEGELVGELSLLLAIGTAVGPGESDELTRKLEPSHEAPSENGSGNDEVEPDKVAARRNGDTMGGEPETPASRLCRRAGIERGEVMCVCVAREVLVVLVGGEVSL